MNTRRNDDSIEHAPAKGHVRSQKGVALIEFAFILPIFLLLLFGIITFSIALYNKTILILATREGARSGVLFYPGHDDDEIKTDAVNAATQVCQNNLITFGTNEGAQIDTNESPLTDKSLTVTASYTYTGVFIFANVIDLSAYTTMEME